ncbi:MAG: glycosyltransferase family 61 protein [Chlamydiia bacterium]|nr:glycosyltransferase family 61 protein [Chlamydiia bacterium]
MLTRILFFALFCCSLFGHTSAVWNGAYFEESSHPQGEEVVEGETVYCFSKHFFTYGHGLLDALLPLYKNLKEHDLLETPINIVLELDDNKQDGTTAKLMQLLRDMFPVQKLILFTPSTKNRTLYFPKLVVLPGTPMSRPYFPHGTIFQFYTAHPESRKYLSYLRSYGIADHIVYQDAAARDNIVTQFVDHIKKAYQINLPVIKNRVLFARRGSPQKIINEKQLLKTLKNFGFDVKVVHFEGLSIKEQIEETVQAEYLLGVYGSNLTNAIFLQRNSKAVILWPEYAKYFWSRAYCIIHSAFLSVGAVLIEYDKPDHPLDCYSQMHLDSNYFYRVGRKVRLREEMKTMEAMSSYPGAMFEIRRVDMYVDPVDICHHLQRSAR